MHLPHADHMEAIAQAYANAPTYDTLARPAWLALARESHALAASVRSHLLVIETADPEPYPDAPAMCADIARGRFAVSTANCDHPVWTPADNVAFRIAHDVLGHFPSGGDFGWIGENQACGAHEPLLSPLARHALHTECIAQTAYANVYGGFGPQKVAYL